MLSNLQVQMTEESFGSQSQDLKSSIDSVSQCSSQSRQAGWVWQALKGD